MLKITVPCHRCDGPASPDTHNLHMCGTCDGVGYLPVKHNGMLFLDLDGVFADFERGYHDAFGLSCRRESDDDLWAKVHTKPNFFYDLPLIPGSDEFYADIRHMPHVFLTACPKTNYDQIAVQKRYWVRKHLSASAMVLPIVGARHKPLFMNHLGDILIDDYGLNINGWVDAGGYGIKHENFKDTRAELVRIIQMKHRNKH